MLWGPKSGKWTNRILTRLWSEPCDVEGWINYFFYFVSPNLGAKVESTDIDIGLFDNSLTVSGEAKEIFLRKLPVIAEKLSHDCWAEMEELPALSNWPVFACLEKMAGLKWFIFYIFNFFTKANFLRNNRGNNMEVSLNVTHSWTFFYVHVTCKI